MQHHEPRQLHVLPKQEMSADCRRLWIFMSKSCHVQQTWLATSCSFSRPLRFSCSYRSPPERVRVSTRVRVRFRLELGSGHGQVAYKGPRCV